MKKSFSNTTDDAHFSLVVQMPFDVTPAEEPLSRLCSINHVRLHPRTATYVDLLSSPNSYGDYVISPILGVLLSRQVALPQTVVTIADSKIRLAVLSFHTSPQVLQTGTLLGTLCPTADHKVLALSADQTSDSRNIDTSIPAGHNFWKMVAPDFNKEQAAALCNLLTSYRDIFGFDSRPLGQISVFKHRMDTGDASLVHSRPYRVSRAERLVI